MNISLDGCQFSLYANNSLDQKIAANYHSSILCNCCRGYWSNICSCTSNDSVAYDDSDDYDDDDYYDYDDYDDYDDDYD